jgi:hypothetical protein
MIKFVTPFLFFLSSLFLVGQDNNSFLGERIDFDVKYGILKIGEGTVYIDSKIHFPAGLKSPHFLATFKIESSGIINFLYPNLRICYESYISTDKLYPYSTILDMYYKEPEVKKDYYTYSDSIYVESIDNTKSDITKKSFTYQKVVGRDILGTYLFARQYGLDAMSDKVEFPFYLGNRFNSLEIHPFEEIEKIKGNSYNKHQIGIENVRDLPDNKSSYVWMSEDNKPYRIMLGTKFGSITLQVKED